MRRVLAALGRYSKGKTIRALLAASLLAGTAAGATACSRSAPAASAAYAVPAAYGQQVGGEFDCYFVDDIYEVAALKAAGLCPQNAVAVVMPISWQETYWAYYSSPAYYNVYIGPTYRTHYTSVYIGTFSTRYKTQIVHAESTARYKTSSGTVVTGTSKVKFDSGSSATVGHGGGSARTTTVRPCAEDMTTIQLKGSGPSSPGHGGGTARSSRTDTSTTKPTNKAGC